jgi:hypothetical protein
MATWEPIETAPRDGTPILVAAGRRYYPMSCWWSEKHQQWVIRESAGRVVYVDFPLTHWMPLPEPPSDQVEAA